MITVVTFLWRGWRPIYTAQHVNAWARMIHAHVKQPHRCVCITDMPQGITGCETFPLWSFPDVWEKPPLLSFRHDPRRLREGSILTQVKRPSAPTIPKIPPPPPQPKIIPNSFLRLRLFDPAVARWLGDRLLCLDLDCVITGDLDPLITDEPVRFVRGVTVPLNGSMWQLEVGQHREVWDTFDPIESPQRIVREQMINKRLSGSDQAWLSLMLPEAPTWGPEHGVHQFIYRQAPPVFVNERIVFFAGPIKPWECQAQAPDLYETYCSYLEA